VFETFVPSHFNPSANLVAVKLLRVCLLVVLAVLVPVRGAMGAAMPCMPAGLEMPAEVQMQVHDGAHHPCHDEASSEASQQTQSCERCAAFCSLTPLLQSVPALAEPQGLGTMAFPDLNAPSPSFESGGPERPPRSI